MFSFTLGKMFAMFSGQNATATVNHCLLFARVKRSKPYTNSRVAKQRD